MSDQRNLILAIALSVAIIMIFQFVIAPPRPLPPKEQPAPTAGAPAPAAPAAPAVPAAPAQPSIPGQPAAPAAERAASLVKAPRIKINTPSLHGSISLQGGRIDDLTLVKYRETPDPKSPEIVLLSPSGAPHAYFAEFGLVPANGTTQPMPGRDTVWSTGASELTPDKPVTLTWDNGKGLLFTRSVAVDKDYLFTVTQKVENRTDSRSPCIPTG